MAGTYTQLYIHMVFAVRARERVIPCPHKDELHRYITGLLRKKKHVVIAINSMPDHLHLLIGIAADVSIAEIVRDVKANSSRFINEQQWIPGKFEWQAGYGAFSCSHSHLDAVAQYIRDQERHHSVQSFTAEYRRILKKFNITFDERYLVDWEQG
jgi:REP element-mobilizing transposase RayT